MTLRFFEGRPYRPFAGRSDQVVWHSRPRPHPHGRRPSSATRTTPTAVIRTPPRIASYDGELARCHHRQRRARMAQASPPGSRCRRSRTPQDRLSRRVDTGGAMGVPSFLWISKLFNRKYACHDFNCRAAWRRRVIGPEGSHATTICSPTVTTARGSYPATGSVEDRCASQTTSAGLFWSGAKSVRKFLDSRVPLNLVNFTKGSVCRSFRR